MSQPLLDLACKETWILTDEIPSLPNTSSCLSHSLVFQHQPTPPLLPHSPPELAPYSLPARVLLLQSATWRSIMPSLLASALASIGMSGKTHLLHCSAWLTWTSHLSRDNVFPLVSNVLGARYKGFTTLEAAQEYYLASKRMGKVRIVRDPGDDQAFGPESQAIQ